MSSPSQPSAVLRYVPPALVAIAAFFAVVAAIDPAGDYPRWPAGPGVTLDEPFNVEQGVILANSIRDYRIALLHPDTAREVFGHAIYLPDHPPFGRVWIGAFHELARSLFPAVENATPYVVTCARTAPAAAFAVLVFLLGAWTSKQYGPLSGCLASISLVLMPRVFGHAHLASLESFMNLTFAAAVMGAAAWSDQKSPRARTALWAGLLFGLALLTKIQAVLLPVPLALWALWHWRHRAILPLAIWGIVGFLVFFAMWPWLWFDSLEHLERYFRQTTQRTTIEVWYFGERYDDKVVPWHYPFVMFAVTVPLGLHMLGCLGLFAKSDGRRFDRRAQLLLWCILFPLVLFSVPGIRVYDGARLFLVVFPLWAVFVGRGGASAFDWMKRKTSMAVAVPIFSLFIAAQGYGIVATHPAYLSYYNLAVGGLRGAERLGLEVTYWGDSVTRDFLEDAAAAVPAGSTVHVFPVLHPVQLDFLTLQSPILRKHDIKLTPYIGFENPSMRYLLVFRRRADLPEPIRDVPPDSRLLAELKRESVQLTALYELHQPSQSPASQ